MLKYIGFILIAAFAVMSVLYIKLGYDYNTIGYGLHPALSTAVVMLCAGMSVLVFKLTNR